MKKFYSSVWIKLHKASPFSGFVKKALILVLSSSLLCLLPSFVADILITNHSFESGLTGWTQMYPSPAGGNGSITAVTEQADDGSQSLKLVDNDSSKNFGMESTKIACSPGTVYAAFARVRLVSGSADLYLRFWNGTTLLAGPAVSTVTGSLNQWQNIAAKLTAPSGATHVSVMVYSNTSNIGTAYWDKILITREYTNLGVQVYDAAPNGTTFGIGSNAHKAYSVVVGADTFEPKMMVIDTNTETVIQTITFPSGPTGAWAATTASTGDIYFGTYSNGTLYRHIPGQSTITNAVTVSGETQIFDLAAGTGGRIYGGTTPNAMFFSYTPATPNTATQISTKPFVPATEYVRSLAHDAVNGVTYLSVGVETGVSGTGIYRYHHGLAEKVNIMPATALAGAMHYTGGRVFAVISGVAHVLNVVANANGSHQSTTEDATFSTKGQISPALNGKVYYFTTGGVFYSYDIASKTSTAHGGGIGSSANVMKLAWVNNKLVGVSANNNQTYVVKYDPAVPGSLTSTLVSNLAKNPGALNEVQGGPDGKIYTSAYLTGGLGVYNTIRGDSNDSEEELMYSPISQIDRMAAYDGKLYIGAYPGAFLYEYNPSQPWAIGTNPKFLMNGAATPYFQDRPKAIVGASTTNGNYVFMGSVAQTGKYNGAVAWYNLGTQQSGLVSITDQSAISMAVYGTQLFVGTSVRRGFSTTPNTTVAKVLVYNITTTGITYLQTLSLPVNTLKSITKMLVVGTKIWGFADGHIFVLNPTTKVFESCNLKFPAINYGTAGTYRDADMFMVPKDPNNVYGTIAGNIGGYLVKIPVSTITPVTITTGADKAAFDSFGNLYYQYVNDKTRLGRYALTVTNGATTLSVPNNPEPTITSFTGCSNDEISIIGTNLLGASDVSFGGIPAGSFSVISSTLITARPVSGATGNITVKTPNGITSIPGFKFIPTPEINPNGSITLSTSGNVVLKANTGSGYIYKWTKDEAEINGAKGDAITVTKSGWYSVSIISESCIITSAPVFINSEDKSVNVFDSEEVVISPNPFKDLLVLNLGSIQVKNAEIEIHSIGGKLVYSGKHTNENGKISLDLAQINSGVYLLKLTTDTSVKVYKIFKE